MDKVNSEARSEVSSEFSSFREDFEREVEEFMPDENEILSLARRDGNFLDADNLRAQVVEFASLLPEETAMEFNALILNAPYGTAKFRVGLLKPLSPDDKRRFSRILNVFSTSETAIKYQILDGMLFEILMREAYEKRNLTKTQKRKEQQQTRQTKIWGDAGGAGDAKSDAARARAQEEAVTIEELAGKRLDISNLTTYYEIKKKLDAKAVSENSLETFTFVKFLLQDFILSGASDLHVHSERGGGRIRYRYQGRLYNRFEEIPTHRFQQLVNSLCTLAAKDPARMKQDVVESVIKLKITLDNEVKPVEFRFESLPTLHSPSVNLRGQSRPLRDINEIGLSPEQIADILNALSNDRGIVIVTGPTGSGKTNTLNCMFAILEADGTRNIIEIGSPIEIESPFRVQLNVTETPSEKATDIIYQKYFKACMRFDPDVIGFTEIRNADEARIAFRAAVTGHLVFTTLHAADVEETFGRLFEMGIDRSIIAKGVLAIVAQTLIRKLCLHCRILDAEASQMAGTNIYRENEAGCSECDGGFKGQTAISEVLRFNPDVQQMIVEGYKQSEIARIAVAREMMIPMKRAALDKHRAGITSESEVCNLIELKTVINSDAEAMPHVSGDDDALEALPVQDAEYVDIEI